MNFLPKDVENNIKNLIRLEITKKFIKLMLIIIGLLDAACVIAIIIFMIINNSLSIKYNDVPLLSLSIISLLWFFIYLISGILVFKNKSTVIKEINNLNLDNYSTYEIKYIKSNYQQALIDIYKKLLYPSLSLSTSIDIKKEKLYQEINHALTNKLT